MEHIEADQIITIEDVMKLFKNPTITIAFENTNKNKHAIQMVAFIKKITTKISAQHSGIAFATLAEIVPRVKIREDVQELIAEFICEHKKFLKSIRAS